MRTMQLIRKIHTPDFTMGELHLETGLTLYTIERPWLDNQPFVSCIPDGAYQLEWDTTGRIKNVPRLRDVPGRTQINIHSANTAGQLHGCIAPGLSWEFGRVGQSRKAMSLLLEYIPQAWTLADGQDVLNEHGHVMWIDIRSFTASIP